MSSTDKEDTPTLCYWCHAGNVPLQHFMDTSHGTQKFCSERCFLASRRAAFKSQKICDWCKKSVSELAYHSRKSSTAAFCTEHCANSFDNNLVKIIHEKTIKSRSPILDNIKIEKRQQKTSTSQRNHRNGSNISSSNSNKSINNMLPSTSSMDSQRFLMDPSVAEIDNNLHLWLQMQSHPLMQAWFLQQQQQQQFRIAPPLPPSVIPSAPSTEPATLILPKPVMVPIPVPLPIPIPIFKTAPEILSILSDHGWEARKSPESTTILNVEDEDDQVRYRLDLPDEGTQAMDLSVKQRSNSSSPIRLPPRIPPNYFSRRQKLFDAPAVRSNHNDSKIQSIKDKYRRGGAVSKYKMRLNRSHQHLSDN